MQTITVKAGKTDVSINALLLDSATGAPKTGLTIADIDLVYARPRAAAVKNDATALAAVDSAHADNKAIEIDSTNAPGLYRCDFADAAFAAGVEQVTLIVREASCLDARIDVSLDPKFDPAADEVKLTGDYDAAKTAAQEGDEMALTGAAIEAVKQKVRYLAE